MVSLFWFKEKFKTAFFCEITSFSYLHWIQLVILLHTCLRVYLNFLWFFLVLSSFVTQNELQLKKFICKLINFRSLSFVYSFTNLIILIFHSHVHEDDEQVMSRRTKKNVKKCLKERSKCFVRGLWLISDFNCRHLFAFDMIVVRLASCNEFVAGHCTHNVDKLLSVDPFLLSSIISRICPCLQHICLFLLHSAALLASI